MRRAVPFRSSSATPRLAERTQGERTELWTETVGAPPAVYGERWTAVGVRAFRSFEPARSKLAAGIDRGWAAPLPQPGERWLYLGAASGTTASHVADLVGREGRVYAIERSVRPFVRLLTVADRWPNLLPVLGDARTPEAYADLVPIVDGIYADVAQPDQTDLVRANATYFLREERGAVVVALKTSSMGRGASAQEHVRAAEASLAAIGPVGASLRLAPFFRSHFLLSVDRATAPPRRPPRRSLAGPRRPGRSFGRSRPRGRG